MVNEDFDDLDAELLDDDDLEDVPKEEVEKVVRENPVRQAVVKAPPRQEPPSRGRPGRPPAAPKEEEAKDRFVPFAMPARFGVMDNEKQQPIAESGELGILTLQILADIQSRLERIEKSL